MKLNRWIWYGLTAIVIAIFALLTPWLKVGAFSEAEQPYVLTTAVILLVVGAAIAYRGTKLKG